MKRYRLIIEYEGTNFCGWQTQKDGTGVQDALESIISEFLQEKILLTGASRTDAGVHAKHQVAHFDININNFRFVKERFINTINFFLKNKGYHIRLIHLEEVDANFHSRFNAKIKTYVYNIINQFPNSLFRDHWHIGPKLNLDDMIQSCKMFLGEKDFSAFRAKQCQAKSPIKTIDEIIIQIKPSQFSYKSYIVCITSNDCHIKNNFSSNEQIIEKSSLCDLKLITNMENMNTRCIEIYFIGKSFLHHMIRNIVGTIVHIGLGKINLQDLEMIIENKNRALSGPTAPAHGLCLLDIKY